MRLLITIPLRYKYTYTQIPQLEIYTRRHESLWFTFSFRSISPPVSLFPSNSPLELILPFTSPIFPPFYIPLFPQPHSPSHIWMYALYKLKKHFTNCIMMKMKSFNEQGDYKGVPGAGQVEDVCTCFFKLVFLGSVCQKWFKWMILQEDRRHMHLMGEKKQLLHTFHVQRYFILTQWPDGNTNGLLPSSDSSM